MQSFLLSEKTVSEELYARVLAYPDGTIEKIRLRLLELRELDVERIDNVGNTFLKQAPNIRVLGVGYTGVVVLARVRDRAVALKIRRTDSARPDLREEATFLRMANQVGVGPALLGNTRNFIVMEYIQGDRFLDWANNMARAGNIEGTRAIVRDILEQSFRLDVLGLDRGDMSCISEDAIVRDRDVVLIDFSAASCDRRPANLTCLTQGLFWGSKIAPNLRSLLHPPPRETLIPILRRYKHQRNRENFARLLEAIFL